MNAASRARYYGHGRGATAGSLDQEDFYQSEAWLRARYHALKAHGGRCQACGERQTGTNPIHVDHIKPRSKFPELALDLSNLQVLCRRCNVGKGATDQTDWRDIQRGTWGPMPVRELLILTAVLNHPWLLIERAEEFSTLSFSHQRAIAAHEAIIAVCATGTKLTRSTLRSEILRFRLDVAANDIVLMGSHYRGAPIGTTAAPGDVHQWWLRVIYTEPEIRSLNARLNDIYRSGAPSDDARISALWEKLRTLESAITG